MKVLSFTQRVRARVALSLLPAALLTACGGSSGVGTSSERSGGSSDSGLDSIAPPPVCSFMPAGSTIVGTPGCATCAVTDAEKAIDGDLTTVAKLGVGGVTLNAGDTLRATAPAGVVFPALSEPGVFWNAAFNDVATSVVLATYLGGQLQESFTLRDPTNPMTNTNLNPGDVNDLGYWSITAAKPFDAIEFTPTMTGIGAFTVNEICSDGGL